MSSLHLVGPSRPDLPVAAGHISGWKPVCRGLSTGKHVFNPGNRKSIFVGYCIQLSKIHIKSPTAVNLPDQHYRHSCWSSVLPKNIQFQSTCSPFLFLHQRCERLIPLSDRCRVSAQTHTRTSHSSQEPGCQAGF